MEENEFFEGELTFKDLEIGDMFYSQIPEEEDILFYKFSDTEAELSSGEIAPFDPDEPVLFAGHRV